MDLTISIIDQLINYNVIRKRDIIIKYVPPDMMY